jgi:DNA-binding NtrC family response regulator
MSSPPTVVLVSRTNSVIELVKAATEQLPNLCFELSPPGERACSRARRPNVALVLVELDGGGDGEVTQILRELAAAQRPCATVVLSATYQPLEATALLRAGAADYLELPAELPRLNFLLNVLTHRCRSRAMDVTRAAVAADFLYGVVAECGVQLLIEQVERVAQQETTVLLTGETGTGKTRLSRLLHQLSPRHAEPFLVVDCGALSAGLIESELFGHGKGACTCGDRDRRGKLAAAGTLLLDGVNYLPLTVQSRLRRALDERAFEPVGSEESRPMKARLIVASDASLPLEVQAGRFRADLYYCLNVVGLFLPPLRERRASIPHLAWKFLLEMAQRNRPNVVGLSQEAMRALEAYHWPGNIPELRNVLERAVALCPGPKVELTDLPEPIRIGEAPRPPEGCFVAHSPGPNHGPTFQQSNDEVEARRIRETLLRN